MASMALFIAAKYASKGLFKVEGFLYVVTRVWEYQEMGFLGLYSMIINQKKHIILTLELQTRIPKVNIKHIKKMLVVLVVA